MKTSKNNVLAVDNYTSSCILDYLKMNNNPIGSYLNTYSDGFELKHHHVTDFVSKYNLPFNQRLSGGFSPVKEDKNNVSN